jgi:hypothetical protein
LQVIPFIVCCILEILLEVLAHVLAREVLNSPITHINDRLRERGN